VTRYTVRFEQDEDGWWIGTVKELQGVHTQGRSVETVRRRIREAIDAAGADARAALEEEFALDGESRRALAAYRREAKRLEDANAAAEQSAHEVAKRLTSKMSVRDAGAILGLTGARVQQLAKD
jgi:predicted RNase H-like HicB family nuclease